MSIVVTGSVAFDHIMVFEDHFRNHILADKVHMINVSFTVPSLEKRWGGTAALRAGLRLLRCALRAPLCRLRPVRRSRTALSARGVATDCWRAVAAFEALSAGRRLRRGGDC